MWRDLNVRDVGKAIGKSLMSPSAGDWSEQCSEDLRKITQRPDSRFGGGRSQSGQLIQRKPRPWQNKKARYDHKTSKLSPNAAADRSPQRP
jgi:hypothetical protein